MTGNYDICIMSMVTHYSLANSVDSYQNYWHYVYLSKGVTLTAMFIFLHYMRAKQREKATKIDEKYLTPSDYAVLIENIPQNIATHRLKQEMKDFFQNEINHSRTLKIMDIMIIYDLQEFQEAKKEWKDAEKALQNVIYEKYQMESGNKTTIVNDNLEDETLVTLEQKIIKQT